MDNNYYRGFIETCASYGMDKSAADMLYKQALPARLLINTLRTAQKAGKPLASVAVRGRNFVKDKVLVNKALRMLTDPQREGLLLSKKYFDGNRAALDEFRRYVSTYDAPVTTAARVSGGARAHGRIPVDGALRRARRMSAERNFAQLTGREPPVPAAPVPSAAAGVSGGVPTQMMLPGFENLRAAPGAATRVNVGARNSLTAQQRAQQEAAFRARGQQPASPVPAAAETPVSPSPAAGVSPEVANNAVNEMAAGAAGPGWLGQTVAQHPYMSLAAVGVPAFMAGSMYANKNR